MASLKSILRYIVTITRKIVLILIKYFLILFIFLTFFYYVTLNVDSRYDLKYILLPWNERMDKKVVRYEDNFNYKSDEHRQGIPRESWSPKRLQDLLQKPTSKCRKLVSVGGSYDCTLCKKCYKDGHKFLCLDHDVRPKPSECVVLSFGIGEDMSFDKGMARFNCRVYAFDMSVDNSTNRVLEKNLHFLKIGLWHEDAVIIFKVKDKKNEPTTRTMPSYMRSLYSIVDILDLKNRKIDYLKMDIESSEWKFFENIFNHKSKSSILKQVSQIAIEIHLDELKNATHSEREMGGRRYEKVLESLGNEGFQLVNTELNTFAQVYSKLNGFVFPLFRESLYIQRKN